MSKGNKTHAFERHCVGEIKFSIYWLWLIDWLCIIMKIWNQWYEFKQRSITTKQANKLTVAIPYRRFDTTCWCNLQESRNPIRVLEDGIDWLSKNIGKEIPLYTASYPRRTQILSTWRRKPEMKFLKKNCWEVRLNVRERKQ
jgi:hypothetical protein